VIQNIKKKRSGDGGNEGGRTQCDRRTKVRAVESPKLTTVGARIMGREQGRAVQEKPIRRKPKDAERANDKEKVKKVAVPEGVEKKATERDGVGVGC